MHVTLKKCMPCDITYLNVGGARCILNKRGIITEPIRLDIYTGKKMTFFYDPDNLPLEIHE